MLTLLLLASRPDGTRMFNYFHRFVVFIL